MQITACPHAIIKDWKYLSMSDCSMIDAGVASLIDALWPY